VIKLPHVSLQDSQQAARFWMRVAFGVWAMVVTIYFLWMAADRYVSVAQFRVSRGAELTSMVGGLASVLGGTPDRQDAYVAISYIRSADMLRLLDGEFDLREHYRKGAGVDLLVRLEQDASGEDLLAAYRRRVRASFHEVQGMVTLEVEAFGAEMAHRQAEAILRHTEDFLNEQNRVIAKRRMEFVADELSQNEQRLQEAKNALIRFQNEHAVVDPALELSSGFALIQELKKQKAFTRAELLPIEENSPDSPKLKELRALIDVLEQEIQAEANRLTGESKERLNQLLAGYEEVKQKLEFAQERYRQNLVLAEETRLQSIQDHRFFTLVASPLMPDQAVRPRRLYLTISLLVLGAAVLQVVRVVGLTIAEHKS
jgi:capsular polysaccharide transport system permease protein